MRNLIVVVADTLRRLDSIHQLNLENDAPFLNDFVGSSVSFDKAIASSSWTPPSHWCLLNGIDPWQIRSAQRRIQSGDGSGSFAGLMRERGGVALGLSQNEMLAKEFGLFSEYEGMNRAISNRIERVAARISGMLDFGLGLTTRRMMETNSGAPIDRSSVIHRIPSVPYVALKSLALCSCGALSSLRTSRAGFRNLASIVRSHGTSRPVHVFVNLMSTHEPYVGLPTSAHTNLRAGCIPTSNLSLLSSNLDAFCVDPAPLRALYRSAVCSLDRSLRILFDVLRRTGILDDALVCLVSDHGQSLGENGFFGHGWALYDELVRIPAYIWQSGDLPITGRRGIIPEWVDHRHLHDVLVDQLVHSGKSLKDSVRDSLDRRGPALSWFRGTPVSGFNPARRLPSFERVRVWQDDSQIEMSKAANIPEIKMDRFIGKGATALRQKAEAILSRGADLRRDNSVFSNSGEISERLLSWGYV